MKLASSFLPCSPARCIPVMQHFNPLHTSSSSSSSSSSSPPPSSPSSSPPSAAASPPSAVLEAPDVQELLRNLETNRAVQEAFVLSLSDHARRSISILGASAENKSQANVAALDAVLDTADADDDGNISRREFSVWITQQADAEAAEAVEAAAAGGSSGDGADGVDAATQQQPPPPPTNRQIMLLGAGVSIPMIGFGFMDNFIMIIAGDAIDASIGTYFGLSMMASAALGNLVSDVMGIGLGDVVDTVAKKAGLPPPELTKAQMAQTRTKLIALLFSSLGIAIGCILGMVPLLFMEDDWTREMRDAFEALDTDGDGTLHASDFMPMFEELGVPNPAAAAAAVVEHIGEDVQSITFKEYLVAMRHLRDNTPHLEKSKKGAAASANNAAGAIA